MAQKKYIVNGKVYSTQGKLLETIREILYAYKDGEVVNWFDRAFLLSLVENYHPSAPRKIGAGVSHFEVRQNPTFRRNRGFWIVRVDGTETDFSFMECLRPSNALAKFKTACRNAVSADVVQIKTEFWQVVDKAICPITGHQIVFGNSDLHHAGKWDFDSIVMAFISDNDVDVDQVKLTGRRDGVIGDWFEDDNLALKFRDYHNERADLQMVSASANH